MPDSSSSESEGIRVPRPRPRGDRSPRNESFVDGPRGPIRTSQPEEDTVRQDLLYAREHGRAPVRVRIASNMLDESSFAVLVRLDQLISLRARLNDDKFVLDEIEQIFTNQFSDMLGR